MAEKKEQKPMAKLQGWKMPDIKMKDQSSKENKQKLTNIIKNLVLLNHSVLSK